MRCNPLRWLWGLLPLAMMAWLGITYYKPVIERDLTQRTTAALKQAGLDSWASVGFDGRDGVLVGSASEDGDPSRALQIAAAVWGVRAVDNRATLIEKAEKYLWSAQKVGTKIRVGGYYPNQTLHRDIIAAAKSALPGLEVEDVMKPARGAPDRDVWLSGIGFGLKQLARLKTGKVELEGTSLSIEGETDTSPDYQAVETALASALPGGVKLREEKVLPPVISPYRWLARIVSEKEVLIEGFAPNARTRQDIVAAAKKAFPTHNISDRMLIGSGEPRRWLPMVTGALESLGKLVEGTAEIRDVKASVKGVALTDAAADVARKTVRSPSAAGATYEVNDQIVSRETEERAKAEAEAKRKAEEAAKLSANDTEAKKRAEEAARVAAAEADSKRKADEAARLAAEADSKKKAEEAARLAAEADAKKKAEEARKAAEEKARREAAVRQCQTDVSAAASSGTILFQRASAELTSDSSGVLDRIAKSMRGCGNARIEIQGHTDAEGTPERNHNLSERRAHSVRDYLVRAGVSAEQLSANGYGETKPLADNSTPEGRAKNRRIEFVVSEQ